MSQQRVTLLDMQRQRRPTPEPLSSRLALASPVRPATVTPPPLPNWTQRPNEQATAALEIACDLAYAKLGMEPRTHEADGRRYLALWDAAEWSVRTDGSEFWCKPVHHSAGFFYPTSDLFMPVSRIGWPSAFGAVLNAACVAVSLDPAVLPGPTGDWIRRGMRKTFEHAVDWNRLRRDALAWLALDPVTLALHRRIFIDHHVGLETFNWVNRHLRDLSLVAIERPGLLPFLSLVRTSYRSPVGELEKKLGDAGITPRGRRWLEKVGFEPFEQATEFGFLKEWPEVVARYGNLLERLQIRKPAGIFTASVASQESTLPDWFFLAMHREIERLIDEEGLEDPDALPDSYEEVVRWAHEASPKPDANQRRAGWDWMRTQALRHRIELAMRSPEPWDCPYRAFIHDGFDVRPLTSILQLREEALEMRNCLETYASDCLDRLAQPFSIRDAAGHRVACFMLEREHRGAPWEIQQVAGPLNRPAPETANEAAAIARDACNEADSLARRRARRQPTNARD